MFGFGTARRSSSSAPPAARVVESPPEVRFRVWDIGERVVQSGGFLRVVRIVVARTFQVSPGGVATAVYDFR